MSFQSLTEHVGLVLLTHLDFSTVPTRMMVSAKEPLAVIPRDCGSNHNSIVMVGRVRRNVGKNATDFLFYLFFLARFARVALFFPFFSF